ncbi:splicing factor, Prp19-binding domain-containing protein [Podospora appendiculata]|uniref:Splicing factor, Prp19-binding domain-containing protein n=1 Tax=Podospora appendiculata TaxID=314037 RepID=A0AAE1CA44_9PEZI|nr:splicing factor, Prp19-binding domain-containing protein [Podospora appendiculata]
MPPKRMTANPVKPARYRAGKAAAPESESESEGSGSEQDETEKKAAAPRKIAPPPKFASAAGSGAGRIISRGNNAKINLGVQPEDEEKRRAEAAKARIEAERRAKEAGFVTEDEDDDGNEGESASGSGSGSEEGSDESSSEEEEEEAPRRLMLRPKFIPRSARNGNAPAPNAPDDESAAAEVARLKAADEMVEAQIAKDLAARKRGKKHWDDDTDPEDEVDDTDDVDPAGEYAAWKLREMLRIRRERAAIEAKEAELAEIERRRALTDEERRAEDDAHLAAQRDEKDARGKMGYMQKYFHKGAFYRDESKALGLDARDLMGARFADDVRNRELLPKSLQLRDMTKVGKKGATRYRDLKSEDTGQWGRLDDGRPRRGDFDRFGDERFQPDRGGFGFAGDRGGAAAVGGEDVKGANAIPLGDRRTVAEAPRGERPRAGEERRDRDRDDSRHGDRRKRSPSRERDRHEGDKRRRVEAK